MIYARKNVGTYHGIALVQQKNLISAKHARINKIEKHYRQTERKNTPKNFITESLLEMVLSINIYSSIIKQ